MSPGLLLTLSIVVSGALSSSAQAMIADDGRTPAQRYLDAGLHLGGAYDVSNPEFCSASAAKRVVNGRIYENDYFLKIDRTTKEALYVSDYVSYLTFVLNRASTALISNSDPVVVKRHVCVGLYEFPEKGGNAFSYPEGYIAIDPRLVFRTLALSSGGGSIQHIALHEYAHQLLYWHGSPFRQDATLRREELTADCIASALQVLSERLTEWEQMVPHVSRTLNAAIGGADTDFDTTEHHGTSIERGRSVLEGVAIVTAYQAANGSAAGLTGKRLIDRCTEFILHRDREYGDNWPNVSP